MAQSGSSARGDANASTATSANTTFWRDSLPQSAIPPVVPRFLDRDYPHSHGRKRSNTGSRIPPPLSFKGFSDRGSNGTRGPVTSDREIFAVQGHAPQPSLAGVSVGTNGSSDIYQQSSISQRSSSYGTWGLNGGPLSTGTGGLSSSRTSDASARPGGVVNNFFDAVGTVRMEAFISPLAGIPDGHDDIYEQEKDDWFSGVGSKGRNKDYIGSSTYAVGGGMRRRGSRERMRVDNGRRTRNRESVSKMVVPMDDWYSGSRTAGEEEYGYNRVRDRGDDPFRGF